LILFIVKSNFGQNYNQVYLLSSALSSIALIVLILAFKEEKLSVWEEDRKIDVDIINVDESITAADLKQSLLDWKVSSEQSNKHRIAVN